MQLLTITVRHERRIRLGFDLVVGAGGFTSTSFYAVTSLDGKGSAPGVVKAVMILSSLQVVELQLDTDLVSGALYSVSAVAVPGADASVTPNPSALSFFFGDTPVPKPAGLDGISALDAALYGIDLAFNGDFLESASGDLAVVSGPENVRGAGWRRAFSEGLPWAPGYGLHPREFVDATPGSLGVLRGRAEAQMRRDDRIRTASAALLIEGLRSFLAISITPIGVGQVDAIKVPLSR